MATFVLSDDLRVMARNLQRKFTTNFGELNLDKIVFLKELDAKPKNKIATTKQIGKAEKVIYGQHDYIVIVYQKRWIDLLPAQKNLHLMQQLLKCKWDGDGLRKFDVEDFYELSHSFGVDWPYNEQVRDPMAPASVATLTSKPAVVVEDGDDDEPEDVVEDPEQD
jgi:hypothetical protein